jgi:hypothetical protein
MTALGLGGDDKAGVSSGGVMGQSTKENGAKARNCCHIHLLQV